MNDSTPDVPTAAEADENLSAAPEQDATAQPAEHAPAVVEEDASTEDATTDAPAEGAAPDNGAAESPDAAGTTGDTEGEPTDGVAAESAEESAEDTPAETSEERMRRLEEEGDIAADYLEELLDIADLDGDIDIDVDGDRASVEIAGADRLATLNRPKGELLDALQELTRLAVQSRTGNRSRLMLDIGGFRAEHKGSLEELAEKAVAEAKEGDAAVPLRPMNPFERKVVHDVAKREGLRSESDGDGKNRHVVIYSAS
ncbi:R3H domain-containing nucleic acid-binding protein [Brachybacterium tyrofermentans]|uniref:R3H domain-containing nucleic acid-binding protein n=1 Tax=Brachybacterium tyrofermentans TaxID=47848 RepID=UPI003FD67BD1